MNPKILGLGIGFALLLALSSGFTHWQSQVENSQDSTQDKSVSILDESETWRASLEKVPAYSTPVPVAKVNTTKKPPKPVRTPQLTDKRLIAIVEDEQKSVVLINARGRNANMQVLRLGDSWLAPWDLKEIHSDFVIWSNTETQQQQQQYLFKR